MYGPGGVLLGVYDASGNVIEETVYMDDGRPIALARGGVTYPILTDQLGTPRQILDPVAGTPVWTWEAKEPFGSEVPNQTVSGVTFIYRGRFPGQVFDPDTGLVHNGFRDYLESIGRYVQSDPIGLEGGWNTYGYVNGNSLNQFDLYGLWALTAQIYGLYGPLGGGFVLTGKGFSIDSFGLRLGVGVGKGLSFNPKGNKAVENAACGSNSLGLFAEAEIGRGPLSLGAGLNKGITLDKNIKFSGYGGWEPEYGIGHSSGAGQFITAGLEYEGEASAGIEFTHTFH